MDIYEPTAEQLKSLMSKCKQAAASALDGLDRYDSTESDLIRCALSALSAVNMTILESRRVLSQDGDLFVDIDINASDVVASVWWWFFNAPELDLDEEVDPPCAGSAPFIAFAKAALLTEFKSQWDFLKDQARNGDEIASEWSSDDMRAVFGVPRQ